MREQVAQYTAESRPIRDDDLFVGSMAVGDHFTLPDQERGRIWDEMYVEAIESAPKREVKSDAIVTLAR